MRPIGVGTADFKLIKSQNGFLVDKSLLIHDLIDDPTLVYHFHRPEKFGKSLNISMLKYFFEKTEKSNKYLFNELKINQFPELVEKYQGQFPVIHFSFKSVKNVKNKEDLIKKFKKVIAEEFKRHDYLIDYLSDNDLKYFEKIIKNKAEIIEYHSSISKLNHFLYNFHQQKVLILIDDFDSLYYEIYLKNIFSEARNLLSNAIGPVLKDNNFLFKAIITGNNQLSKFNDYNLYSNSILSNKFIKHFGFTQLEIEDIFAEYQFTEEQKIEINTWYCGYIWGSNELIYNPWSVLKYIGNSKKLKPYWIKTNGYNFIKELINNCSIESKKDLEVLLQNGNIQKPITDNFILDYLNSDDNFWSLLFHAGYLKITKQYQIDEKPYGDFQIVNRELKSIFKDSVNYWFEKSKTETSFNQILHNLVNNNLHDFYLHFADFIEQSASYYDFADKEPERVYHALVLGMMVNLQSKYKITSNRESGYGRYDIMLHPLLENLPAYIFEFKKYDHRIDASFDDALDHAITQIREKNYAKQLKAEGFKNIQLIAIAFKGKEVKMCWESV